jgi:phenylacetate-CoA ligase
MAAVEAGAEQGAAAQPSLADRGHHPLRAVKALLRLPAFAAVALIDTAERMFASSGGLYKLLLYPGYERTRWNVGIWRAWRSFYLAHRRVPAYRDFIARRGGLPDIHLTRRLFPDLSLVPEMDKASYVKAYPIHERIKGGKLPRKGVMVDESSGSSGQPTSWVRGPVERRIVSQMMRLSYFESVDRERPVFILNAFALGAWATGMNVSLSLTPCSIVKSTGPNLDKIINTMIEFGPGYRYVIMGYPPFLKAIADDPRIDWSRYVVDAGYGGEGISEGLRTYLGRRFQRVVGSYGASDLEVNLAIETDLTIALRRAISEDQALRDALIRTDYGVTPMIFQYNPMAYFIETNAAGELVVTMSRVYHIAPKIRYNIHDRGHVMRFPELKRVLRDAGREVLLKGHSVDTDLPLLFLYGRSDMSVDYYGANVTPDSIREVIYAVEALAPIVNTYRLLSYEDENANKRMEIAAELVEGATVPANADALGNELFERLAAINGDFTNAWKHTAPADNMPQFTLHPFGTGPFAGGQRKLKNEYVTTDIVYDKLQ